MTVGAIAQLKLVEIERSRPSGAALDERARYVDWLAEPLRQLDFVVDGVSMLQRVLTLDLAGPHRLSGDQFVSVADLAWPQDAADGLRWLLGRSQRDANWNVLEPGRLPIYVCPQCADVYCGALTVAVERVFDPASEQELVRWTQLRLENGYTPPTMMPDLSPLGTFTFDAAHYDAALDAQLDRLDRLTRAEVEAKRRWDQAEQAWKATHGPRAWTRRALRRTT